MTSLDNEIINDIFNKKEQLILNITYETETGRLTLSDNYNNHYSCDLFGRIKTKFLPNITGQASYIERKNFNSARNFQPKNKNENIKNDESSDRPLTSKPLFSIKKEVINYHPIIRKLEGYSKFPRPLSPPFNNLPEYKLKEQIKIELIQHLEKYFSDKYTKDIFRNNNTNKGLSYLTLDLNEFDCVKVDNEKIISLINQTLKSIKEEYNYKKSLYYKLPIVKALSQFSRFLLANKDTTIINNRKLPEPNPKIKKRYECIHSAISRNALEKKNRTKNNYYRNKLTFNNRIKNMKGQIKFRNLTLESTRDNNHMTDFNYFWNSLFKKKDFNIGKKIRMDFGSFLYGEEIRKKIDKNLTLTQDKKVLTETTKETEINKNNLSFISFKDLNDKRKQAKVKGLILMKNRFNKEKDLLKGFQIEERKGFMYLFKNIKPKLKTNGELYDEDMELLRRTNPIAFERQDKREAFNLKQLIKKINTQRINADNIMKGKKLIIKKEDDE